MGKGMLRQRLLSSLVVATACVNAALAGALQSSASALESQAQAEFAKVGTAVRERLDREAAGDVVGARIAAQDADTHRYRFLDIKRAISRLRSPSLASHSVAAPRNPFLPDASFSVPSAPLTRVVPMAAVGGQEALVRVGYPVWDMYRPHELQNRAGNEEAEPRPASTAASSEAAVRAGGGMYSKGVAKPALTDRGAPAKAPEVPASSGEAPHQPFLVYRERLAGTDARE